MYKRKAKTKKIYMDYRTEYYVQLLNTGNYHKALKVALEIFKSDPDAKERIPDAYQKAIFPERFVGLEKNKFVYWALLEKNTNKVVGVTGLYTQNKDKKLCYWLGWFGILPEYQGNGLGLFLFNWTLQEVQRRNKNILRIQTSDLKYTESARQLYKKNQCYQIKRKKEKLKKGRIVYNTILLEKNLIN